MKKTKDFNNVSPELLESVRLKRGEVATFKLLGIKPDPENPGKFLIRSGTSIREFDRTYDPVKEDWVDIAHITSIDREGKFTAQPIYFTKEDAGVITLSGDYPAESDKAAYLRLSSYNQSNEHRDKSVSAKFFEVNPIADAEKNTRERGERLAAMTAAAQLSKVEARELYAALGKDSNDDPKIIREYLESLAESNPSQFNLHFNDKQKSVKASIKGAVDAGVLSIDKVAGKIVWSKTGETLFSFVKRAGVEPINELSDHIVNGKNGDRILAEIKKAVNPAS